MDPAGLGSQNVSDESLVLFVDCEAEVEVFVTRRTYFFSLQVAREKCLWL